MIERLTAQALPCIIILFAVHYVCTHLLWTRTNGKLPPGPRPIPLLGNVHQLPTEYLEQRDPEEHFRLGWEPFIVFLDYGDLWKKHRRWVYGALNDKASLQAWQSVQRREVAVLLNSMNSNPDAYREHLGRYSSALIMETAYGHTVTSSEDEYVHIMNMSMKLTTQGESVAASTVDFIPILKYLPTWMPGADFKRKAQMARPIVRGAMKRPYYMVKALLASGSAKPSVVTSLLEESIRKGTLEEDETDIIFSGGAFYGRTSDD
ncbi:cytochrome P450 [Wolfiporia cocos MD-104 SS10]|uniref:Cytochrome P450 n=1 Tax=Wolfiporia cocos (strain MD-104) TaxID=742152 RepID=A0A2H3JM26_WOLCO|nr:cytochrome P450 [Wolfiporia cocos MD-104 SS10]